MTPRLLLTNLQCLQSKRNLKSLNVQQTAQLENQKSFMATLKQVPHLIFTGKKQVED